MNWTEIPFKKFVTLQRGFDLPKSRMVDGVVPVLGSNCVIGYHNEMKVEAPGVVTGRSGTLGLVQYSEQPFWPHNTALWVKDFKGNNPKFVYYKLKTLHLERFNGGASVPTLNRNVLDTLPIRIPKPTEQRRIASILSAYDDLIENNRRRIQLLEQAAQLLYKEWFIHLRFPSHEYVKIIDGVPEGWEYKQVKDILGKVKRPRKIKKEDFLAEGLIPCIDQSQDFIGGYTDDEEALVDIDQPVIVFGDHTRILKFIDFPFACGADGTQLIVANDKAISQEFLYFALDAIDLSDYFYARHFKFLKDQYIPCPIEALIADFTDHLRPIMQQIKSLRNYSHHLTKARDLLLPRLIDSGLMSPNGPARRKP